jgi:Protein of unknown function/Domain of unknown function (DUF1835)
MASQFIGRGAVMTQTVHFVFTPSGAGCLSQALRIACRDDQVISFFDDLSFGPINPPDSSLRAKWVENELGRTGWDDVTAESERFWRGAPSSDRTVAWLTRRSAKQYAGFLEWSWRMRDAPYEVVDLSNVKISRGPEHGSPRPPAFAMSLGMLHPDIICRDRLWEFAEPLQQSVRERYRDLWQQLRSENAPLRVIDGDELVSAPISFFDSLLMSYVTANWKKVALVVGQALVSPMDNCMIGPGDLFLVARVNSLVENGRMEIRGKSALEMHASEVRLPRT